MPCGELIPLSLFNCSKEQKRVNVQYTFKYGQTNDLEQFSLINFNRTIQPTHSDSIAKSISNINLMGANPIIVANGYVIDGQHRLEACKSLNMPVSYIEIIGMSELDMYNAMHTLNSNAKNWNLRDYLRFYVERELENYIILNDFITTYGLTVSLGIYMLSDFLEVMYKNAAVASGFKSGRFVAKNRNNAVKKAYNYNQVKNFIANDYPEYLKTVKSINFVKAFVTLLSEQESFDPIIFDDALRTDLHHNAKIFGKRESVKDYYNMIVSIYNKNLRDTDNKLNQFISS